MLQVFNTLWLLRSLQEPMKPSSPKAHAHIVRYGSSRDIVGVKLELCEQSGYVIAVPPMVQLKGALKIIYSNPLFL